MKFQPLPRSGTAFIILIASVTGCDGSRDGLPGSQVRSLGALATACDVAATSRVADPGEWIVPPEREVMEPVHNISTTDITRARDGSLIVLDAGRTRVVQLNGQGAVVREWKSRTGQGPGEFAGQARAVALGPDDRVYVSDSGGRIHVFEASGEHVRTINVTGIVDARDIGVFDDGRILLSARATTHGMNKTYVAIVDSTGRLQREVLTVDRDHSYGSRPLLGPFNPVHISMSPSGDFAVWYPLDNYVERFNSAGDAIQRIEGCMPEDLAAHYTAATRSGTSGGSFVPLTLGVSIDASGGIDVVSRYVEDGRKTILRNLRYDANATSPVVRDLDLADGPPAHSAEWLNGSVFALYHNGIPDNGIRRVAFESTR